MPSAAPPPDPGPQPAPAPNTTRRHGTLILDATAIPVNITYPTDTGLLNDARLITEQLIDLLYTTNRALWPLKPRTYRQAAHKLYQAFAKTRNKTDHAIKEQRKQQLAYLKRNFTTLNNMLDLYEQNGLVIPFAHRHWRQLWVTKEVDRQQRHMYTQGQDHIDHRILSLHQPHIRAIKRGKSGGRSFEFGPKINLSYVGGFATVDLLSFNTFNEVGCLPGAVEAYHATCGHYPQVVLADAIFWSRANRTYLRELGIEHNGVPLGPKTTRTKHYKTVLRKRHVERQAIEGKFGELKQRYGLSRICTRRPDTQAAQIALTIAAANVQALMRKLPAIWLALVALAAFWRARPAAYYRLHPTLYRC